jgi:chemotaxis protein methyltransferase CheR
MPRHDQVARLTPMNKTLMNDPELVRFLQWCLPKLGLRWAGFRKVRGTVRKRLNRRIRELKLSDLAAYRDRLETDPDEWGRLEVMCRIPISRFYRDKAVYDFLGDGVLPACAQAARLRKGQTVRVLSAGCASGEEPYTISLIWTLRLANDFPGVVLHIAALDIDDTMLRRAEEACYAAGSLKHLPSDLRENGFEVVEGLYSELDAKLRSNGYLVIGRHESLPGEACGYDRLTAGLTVYRKR